VRPNSAADMDAVARIVADLTGMIPARDDDVGLITAPVSDPVLLSAVVRRMDTAGIVVDELALRLPSLDDVFLALTGKPVAEVAE